MRPPPCRGVRPRCYSRQGGAQGLTAETRGPTRGHRPASPGRARPGGIVPMRLGAVPGPAGATVGRKIPGGTLPRGTVPGAASERGQQVQRGMNHTGRRYTRAAMDHRQKSPPRPHTQGGAGGARPRPDGRKGEGGRQGLRARRRRRCRGRPRRLVSAAPVEGGEQARPCPAVEGGRGRRQQAGPRGPPRAGVEGGWPQNG